MGWPPSLVEDGAASCLKVPLAVVDAATERPAGPEGMFLRRRVCPGCPIQEACLVQRMTGEIGVWGGTGPHARTTHGAPHWKAHRAG